MIAINIFLVRLYYNSIWRSSRFEFQSTDFYCGRRMFNRFVGNVAICKTISLYRLSFVLPQTRVDILPNFKTLSCYMLLWKIFVWSIKAKSLRRHCNWLYFWSWTTCLLSHCTLHLTCLTDHLLHNDCLWWFPHIVFHKISMMCLKSFKLISSFVVLFWDFFNNLHLSL